MATRKFRKFSEGGEAADKEAGLKASKNEKVGFFERMRMGNIDDEGSEAYKRFGAGRGKAERVPVEDRVATPVKREAPKVETAKADEDELEAANKREPISVPAGKKAEPDAPAKSPARAEPKPAAKAPAKAAPKADTSDYSNEGRGSKPKADMSSNKSAKSSVDQIPLDAPRTPVKGEKVDSTELGRNINNALNATPGIQAVGRMKSAGQAAQKAGSRALSTAVDDGVTFLGKSGRRQVGGFDELGAAAKQLADNRKAAIARESAATLANNPTKRIGGPSKGDLVARDRAAREAKRRAEMGEENASRYGLDPKSPDYADKAKAIRDSLGGSDFSLGMKKGGAVKGWGMARGARKAKIV